MCDCPRAFALVPKLLDNVSFVANFVWQQSFSAVSFAVDVEIITENWLFLVAVVVDMFLFDFVFFVDFRFCFMISWMLLANGSCGCNFSHKVEKPCGKKCGSI